MSRLDHLWAGWRQAYLAGEQDQRELPDIPEGGSIFSAIERSGLPDEETFVVARGDACFVLLNVYPYTSGHAMVLPKRVVGTLADLTDEEHAELWLMVRDTVTALEAAYMPGGINVGLNQGRAAGAGVPEHLHVHCLPRWLGDTNFLTSVAGARVFPEALNDSWKRLREHWPA